MKAMKCERQTPSTRCQRHRPDCTGRDGNRAFVGYGKIRHCRRRWIAGKPGALAAASQAGKRRRKIMPRFAANLSFLFNEVPFLDRFAAAANAGFNAVEFAFAYEHPAKELTSRLAANGLEQVLINAPPGDLNAGDRGLAGCPGREHEFVASFVTALRYAQALSCPRIHAMAACFRQARMRRSARAIGRRSCAISASQPGGRRQTALR